MVLERDTLHRQKTRTDDPARATIRKRISLRRHYPNQVAGLGGYAILSRLKRQLPLFLSQYSTALSLLQGAFLDFLPHLWYKRSRKQTGNGRDTAMTASQNENRCPHSKKCGGCQLRHMTYEEELRLKEQRVNDALRRIGGLNLTVSAITERTFVYRMKVRFFIFLAHFWVK